MTRSKKMQPITVPIYDWWVFVVVGNEGLTKLEKDWGFDAGTQIQTEMTGACVLMEWDEGINEGLQFNVLYFDSPEPELGTVVHECIHGIHNLMESKGIPSGHENSEVMAYTTEYLVTEVMKKLQGN